MKSIHIMLILIVLLSSCRKKVDDFEYIKSEPKPTLISILTAGEKSWAQVSLANQLCDVHPTICKDAEVLFFKDGTFLEKLIFDNESQLYVGESIIESEHSYTCKAVLPNFDTLTANTKVPNKPRYTGIEVVENAVVDDEGKSRPAFLMTFSVDTTIVQYFNAALDCNLIYSNGIRKYNFKGHVSDNYDNEDPVLLETGTHSLLFTNNIINDTSYTMKINGSFSSTYSEPCYEGDEPQPFHGKIVVRMNGLSESLYNFLKSYYQHYEADAYDNIFIGAITPTNYYSNVENGLGIFGAQACYVSDTIYYNMNR